MPVDRMERVLSTPDVFLARLVSARLGAEGIITEIRGRHSSTYPVGDSEVWVEAERMDDAAEILMVEDIESAYYDEAASELSGGPEPRYAPQGDDVLEDRLRRRRRPAVIAAFIMAGSLILVPIVELVRVLTTP